MRTFIHSLQKYTGNAACVLIFISFFFCVLFKLDSISLKELKNQTKIKKIIENVSGKFNDTAIDVLNLLHLRPVSN